MQITRQADYAVRAMLYLAKQQNDFNIENQQKDPSLPKQKDQDRSATSRIAEAQKIPPSFLAKIISQLSIAGLILTSRGASGGVKLSRPASSISLLEVVEAIDGPISLNECTLTPDICEFSGDCPMHKIWCETQDEMVKKLRQTTFGQLAA
jgi:Rrf2 family protein